MEENLNYNECAKTLAEVFGIHIEHNLCWARNVESIVDETGFSDTFINQDTCNIDSIKTKFMKIWNIKLYNINMEHKM